MTVQTLVNASLRKIGVLGAGETPATEDSNDALDAFNALLANWNVQHLAVYTIVNKQFPLTANVGQYTIGPAGDFDNYRPVKIEAAGILLGGLRYPLQLINSKQYAAIPEKDAVANLP